MTTYATDTFTGDGSTVEFTLTFDYIERDHVTVSRLVIATQKTTVLTAIKTGTPTGDQFIWEADNKIKVGTAPTTAEELVIARDTPENDQIVKWADGSYIIAADLNTSDLQWLYGLQELEDKFGKLQSTAIKYLGAIDLTADAAPVSPSNGDFYINTGSGTVLGSWTGIDGDAVVGSEQVIYNSTISEWQIFQVPSSQSGVVQVKSTAPITVDETDVQRPVVGITNATKSADGAMSSTDKDKLDDIEKEAQKNVNADWTASSGDAEILNKPTIPAAQVNSDWDATSGVAEILNKPTIPAAQVNSDWSAASGVAEILNKPTIPAAQVQSDWTETDSSKKSFIENKPTVIDGDAPSDGKTYGRKNATWSEVQPGGVTKIIAGSNVTISPSGGTGDVTVNAIGGGGGSGKTSGVRYQQGTITPTTTSGVTLGGTGFWSRVGNSVSIQYYVQSSASGNAVTFDISLPYRSSDNYTQNGSSVGSVMFQKLNIGNDKVLTPYIAGKSDEVIIYSQSQIGSPWTVLTGDKITTNAAFFIQVTYLTDDAAFTPINSATTTVDNQGIGGGGSAGVRYQQGSFTASFSGGGTDNSSIGGNSYYQWSRVGNTVSIMMDWTWDTVPTNADPLTIGGLPFPASFWTCGSMYVNYKAGETCFVPYIEKDKTQFQVKAIPAASGYSPTVQMKNEDCAIGYNNVQITYVTDDTTFAPQNSATTTVDIQGGGGSGGGGADAWASFDGDGANGAKTINASFNIASVNKTGTGTYDVVFTTPMGSSDYAVTSSYVTSTTSKTATGFTILTYNSSGTSTDLGDVQFAVNASNAVAHQTGVGADAWGIVNADGTYGGGFNFTCTKVSTGEYQVTFNTPMPSSVYSVNATANTTINSGSDVYVADLNKSGFKIYSAGNTTGAQQDPVAALFFQVFASSTITPTFTWTRDGTTLKPANPGDEIINGDIIAGNGFKVRSVGSLQLRRDGGQSPVFIAYNGGVEASNKVVEMRNDGSAYFDGQLYLGNTNEGDCFVFIKQVQDGGSSGPTRGYARFLGSSGQLGSREAIDLFIDGAKTGSVFYNGSTQFNLEWDKPEHWTQPAEEGAEPVYSGPTLNTLDVLLELKAKVETLEAAKAALEARITTLEGGD